ncbi:MAG: hypothetical protein ACYTBJ_08455 [Planctomycetota bacterium]|jgi:hypothetical protein
MDIFWAMHQRAQVAGAQAQATSAQSRAESLKYHIEDLEERLDQMALKCQALWEIVRDSSGFSDDDILQKINEIDLRDGVADAKITKGRQQCGNCGRTVSTRHSRCLYCGTIVEGREIF